MVRLISALVEDKSSLISSNSQAKSRISCGEMSSKSPMVFFIILTINTYNEINFGINTKRNANRFAECNN